MQNYQDIYSEARKLDNDQLRTLIRSEKFGGQTSGLAKNFLQTNLIILDKMYALDFMIFCQRNPTQVKTYHYPYHYLLTIILIVYHYL